ncbi:hypothetical protein ACF0H5_020170 [Mactra antiquata]
MEMQRKRPRGYYSDTVELGASILPMRQMKRCNATKILKYLCLIALGFCIYSMYEKISDASKSSDKLSEAAVNENLKDREIDNVNDEYTDGDPINRRVKAEINKAFEEFKKKQADKIENGENEFQDDIDNDENGDDNYEGNDDDADDDDFDENDNNYNEDLEQNADIDDTMVEDDEQDSEEEREEIELDKQIEERIADVFKEAFVEAKEEIKDLDEIQGQKDDGVVDKILNEAGNLDVDIPKVQQVFEKREFKLAVDKVGQQLSPLQVKRMNEKAVREAKLKDSDHEFPPFVTAARQTTFEQVKQLIASIQILLPGRKIYIYSLDLTDDQKNELATYCNVRMHSFFIQIFPRHVSDLDSLYWKPLVMQTALAQFAHMIWVNPGFRLATQELAPLIHESHEHGVVILGQTVSYTTLAATHPDMFKFFPVDKEKLSNCPHVEIRAVFIHNTDEIHENFMRMFTSCALEESCLAPKGSKWQCKFDLTGRKPADCHRFDESALNILLKNYFNYDMNKFVRKNTYFKKVDTTYSAKLKVCRQTVDKRVAEL